MEDVESVRFTKGRYAAFALWILIVFTLILIALTIHQIQLISKDDDVLSSNLAITALGFFAIAIPVILTHFLIPPFISSVKWFKGRYTKYTKAAAVTSIIIAVLYSADLGLIAVANFADGYYVQGGVEIMGIGFAIFLIVRCIQFLISLKGYG